MAERKKEKKISRVLTGEHFSGAVGKRMLHVCYLFIVITSIKE